MSEQESRREILKKAAYVVPMVLTLAVKPSLASSGSGRCDSRDEREKREREDEGYDSFRNERESKKPKKNGKKH